MKKNIFFKKSLSTFIVSFFLLNTAHAKIVCQDAQVINSAWGFSNSQVSRLRSDMTEPRNVGVSRADVVSRIDNRIRLYHQGAHGMTSNRMAETIATIASCTGNDFTYLAAVLEQETKFCSDMGTGGNGSGCGQTTGVALSEMKCQMGLPCPAAQDTANPEVKSYFNSTMDSCASQLGDPAIATQFRETFSQSNRTIQRGLQAGTNLTTDILMVAFQLKFWAAKQGGYLVQGSAPGGLACYNNCSGGGRYASAVSNRAQNISAGCFEDIYTSPYRQRACFYEANPQRCESSEMANDGNSVSI